MVKGRIFICYSRDNHAIRDKIQEQLQPFVMRCHWEVWCDGDIPAGDEWHVTVQHHLHNAHVIINVISGAFFRSPYIHKEEVPRVSPRQKIINLIFEESVFARDPLSSYQTVNNGEPLKGASDERAAAIYGKLEAAVEQALNGYICFPLRQMIPPVEGEGDAPRRLSCIDTDQLARMRQRLGAAPLDYVAPNYWKSIENCLDRGYLTNDEAYEELLSYFDAVLPKLFEVGEERPDNRSDAVMWMLRMLAFQPWRQEATTDANIQRCRFLFEGVIRLVDRAIELSPKYEFLREEARDDVHQRYRRDCRAELLIMLQACTRVHTGGI
jgi:hypothetical protein